MTRGPLPPHERAWRHPSELAAPPHEPTSRFGHLLIASTAAVSLLLVGWLAISMTPHRYGDADRVAIATSDGSGASGLALGSPGTVRLRSADGVLRAVSTFLAAQRAAPQSAAGDGESDATTFAGGNAAPPSAASAPSSPEETADNAALGEPTTTSPAAVSPNSTLSVGSEPQIVGTQVPATSDSDNPPAVTESTGHAPAAGTEPPVSSGPSTSGGPTTTSTTSTSTSSTSTTSTSTTAPASTTTVTQAQKQLAG